MQDDHKPHVQPDIDPTWKKAVGEEFEKSYMKDLKIFLQKQIEMNKTICPPPKLFFYALNRTPFDRVRVVIIGQDPYFNPGEAQGMSFSVNKTMRPPSSLRNILKELSDDVGTSPAPHGCLESWADQGVLLLNSILSVELGSPGSHANKGWETFTDKIVQAIDSKQSPVAFLLWGNYARQKAKSVNRNRHLVIESAHPSGLSAHRGFFGSKPFSKINQFLVKNGDLPINWQIT